MQGKESKKAKNSWRFVRRRIEKKTHGNKLLKLITNKTQVQDEEKLVSRNKLKRKGNEMDRTNNSGIELNIEKGNELQKSTQTQTHLDNLVSHKIIQQASAQDSNNTRAAELATTNRARCVVVLFKTCGRLCPSNWHPTHVCQ